MKKNLFEIGEVVILQSVQRPELNGEYTVREVVDKGHAYDCRVSNSTVVHTGGLGYLLEETVADSIAVRGELIEAPWAESALRKKHQGCGDSFQSMMSRLNTKIVENL